MQLLEQLRYNAFWFLDRLKGNPIKRHIDEIRFLNEHYLDQKAIALRATHLQNLLEYATKNVAFYEGLKDFKGLSDFPVINKMMIKESYEAFESKDSKYKKEHKTSTSGSTGVPFKLYQDKIKRLRNIADTIYYAQKSGIKIGMKVYFMRAWNQYNKKKPIQALLQNVKMQDISNFNDKEIITFLNKLSKNRHPKGIWGYASSLDNLANYLENNAYNTSKINLASIVATSEYLNPKTKAVLEKRLNTYVISRYSNAENGMFAIQELGEGYDFSINWASYYFEILKLDSDETVALGEPGRVVLTDLFNYNTPIIRYDIGDIGIIDLNDKNIPVFTKIEGRKQDVIYNAKGEMISAYIISRLMTPYTKILQYQFIQEAAAKYVLKLNVLNPSTFENSARIINELKPYLGDHAEIEIDFIDEIPLLASGKRQRVINNYKKDQVLANG